MAERSKALVLGTSLFGGVGSNPTAARSEPFAIVCIGSPCMAQGLLISLNRHGFTEICKKIDYNHLTNVGHHRTYYTHPPHGKSKSCYLINYKNYFF